VKVYGQVENAQLENWSSPPTAGTAGRIGFNTTSKIPEIDDGTVFRAFQIAGITQTVLESFTFAGLPAAGTQGRAVFVTDRSKVFVDTGVAWIPADSPTANRVAAMYTAIVGSSGQVSSGAADYTSINTAIAALSAGDTLLILKGTYVENVVVNKNLNIIGQGYGSSGTVISGTWEFASGSSDSILEKVRITSTFTIDSGVAEISADKFWVPTLASLIINGTGNNVNAFTG